MIPKILHYCWFGRGEKPQSIQKYIAGWKEHCPDFEIREWNEDNFDVTQNAYCREAYAVGKWAFVSDYVRAFVLHQYGGFYLDTDVEILKPLDDSLRMHNCVLGFEASDFIATSFIGCIPGHPLLKELCAHYDTAHFLRPDGTANTLPNVRILTAILEKHGLHRDGTRQTLPDGTEIFPSVWFSPYDYENCINEADSRSYCVHHFLASWTPFSVRIKKIIKRFLVLILGKRGLVALRKRFK